MISVPCNNCSHMIDVEVTTIELVETTGFGLLCQSCQIEAKTNQRNKKLNKVLSLFRDSHEVSRRGLVQRIKQWLE